MKKLIFSLFVVLIFATNIFASKTQVNGIWYDFDSSTKTASVTYRGSYCDQYNGEYSGSVVIPEKVAYDSTIYSVTTIGAEAFYWCEGLTSVTIPNSVTTIGDYAFSRCSGLTSITIPNSVTTIGKSAFYECSSLTSVTIPNSVTTIGRSAFYNCYGLISVTIGNSVTTIGEYAFFSCTGLTSITIPNSVQTIGKYAFSGCKRLTSVIWNADNYKPLFMDDGETSISPFYDLRAQITSFTLGDNMESIPRSLCQELGKLTTITIPNSVKTICGWAFYKCYGLTSVTIGNSVTELGVDAFCGCSNLTSISCYATTPPSAYNCFEEVNKKDIPVYVPAHSVDTYRQASEWKKFKWIQGFPDEYANITCYADNGFVSGAGKHIKGDNCTLTAIPNKGYEFVNWSNGITDNPYTFIVEQDVELTANFKKVDTGWQDVYRDTKVSKFFHNGSIVIERNGNLYNAQGNIIK